MLVPPIALILGAILGLLARQRPHARTILMVAAPVLSVVALAAQFVPDGVQSCTSTANGSTVCQSLPAVAAWGGVLPYLIAIALVLLSFGTVVSARTGSWLPAGISALLQSLPQVISFGGFLDWAPALVATVAMAFVVSVRGPTNASTSTSQS